MRYEIDGQNLIVSRDTPFLRSYKIDYLSASRNVKMQLDSPRPTFSSGRSRRRRRRERHRRHLDHRRGGAEQALGIDRAAT